MKVLIWQVITQLNFVNFFVSVIGMELELPSAIQLIQMCGLQPEIAQQFTDIRECGAVFQKYFTDAWKVPCMIIFTS